MCGIAGFCDYNDDLSEEAPFWGALAKRMGSQLKHRGPDDSGIHDHSVARYGIPFPHRLSLIGYICVLEILNAPNWRP